MKLELLSLLTKIPVCEICVCHLYNTFKGLLALLLWRKICKQTPPKSQVEKNADLYCH